MRQMTDTLTCALRATQRTSRRARCLNERNASSVRVRSSGRCSDALWEKTDRKHISTGYFEHRIIRVGSGDRSGMTREARLECKPDQ